MKYLILCLFLFGAGCGDSESIWDVTEKPPMPRWRVEKKEGELCVSYRSVWDNPLYMKCELHPKNNEETAERFQREISEEMEADLQEQEDVRRIEAVLNEEPTSTKGIPIN